MLDFNNLLKSLFKSFFMAASTFLDKLCMDHDDKIRVCDVVTRRFLFQQEIVSATKRDLVH